LRGAQAPVTPLKQAFPAFAADSQTWIRHALTLLESHSLRLRHTDIDNAPYGREVHWNSAWAWVIALAGQCDHWLTDRPLAQSVEQMTLWVTGVALMILTVLVSSWAAKRAGAIAGMIVAVAMVGHPRIFEGFFPSYADHHGLLTVAILGLCLGAVFMGAGWWQPSRDFVALLPESPEIARRDAMFSALSGAFGMWVSAASVLPPIAIVGGAGVIAILIQGRDAQRAGVKFDPGVWRTWGRVGAVSSLFFYLLEYFPRHMGLRMEVNHPFYSLAWLGGGELIAQFGERWLDPSRRWTEGRRLIVPVAAVLVAPLTIIIGGTKVFVVMDPFLSRLHRIHIQEFLPLWTSFRGLGWNVFFSVVGLENVALIAGVVLLAIQRRRLPIILWFATAAAIVFTAQAWMQSRWLLNASGSQVCLAILLVGFFTVRTKLATRWIVAALVVGVVFLPHAVTRITGGLADVKARRVGPKDANSVLFRDVAMVIRASQPSGEIVLLTSPNSSTGIGYYGGFKTLGTLYWENNDGLKSAAAILSAQTPEEAATLIKKHGVTHIAMISEENFVEPYYRLLHPDAAVEDVKKCFGYRLLVDRVIPPWLQMIPYAVPEDLKPLNVNALLFKVAFNQTPADALYHIALSKIAMGVPNEAERDFDQLIKGSPGSYQPYLRKGELLFARREWSAAAETLIAGIARMPEAERSATFADAASKFYREGQKREAVRLYRAALADRFVPEIAAYLAFVLATSPDDSLRNGTDAQALAEEALKTQPASPTVLNSLAAALAENGKFTDATAIAERALANARAQNNPDAARVTQARIAAYKAGKPWRE
jgi:tetratricopeptide (TPR) repeat protein